MKKNSKIKSSISEHIGAHFYDNPQLDNSFPKFSELLRHFSESIRTKLLISSLPYISDSHYFFVIHYLVSHSDEFITKMAKDTLNKIFHLNFKEGQMDSLFLIEKILPEILLKVLSNENQSEEIKPFISSSLFQIISILSHKIEAIFSNTENISNLMSLFEMIEKIFFLASKQFSWRRINEIASKYPAAKRNVEYNMTFSFSCNNFIFLYFILQYHSICYFFMFKNISILCDKYPCSPSSFNIILRTHNFPLDCQPSFFYSDSLMFPNPLTIEDKNSFFSHILWIELISNILFSNANFSNSLEEKLSPYSNTCKWISFLISQTSILTGKVLPSFSEALYPEISDLFTSNTQPCNKDTLLKLLDKYTINQMPYHLINQYQPIQLGYLLINDNDIVFKIPDNSELYLVKYDYSFLISHHITDLIAKLLSKIDDYITDNNWNAIKILIIMSQFNWPQFRPILEFVSNKAITINTLSWSIPLNYVYEIEIFEILLMLSPEGVRFSTPGEPFKEICLDQYSLFDYLSTNNTPPPDLIIFLKENTVYLDKLLF
ncbi:hypothetical protein HZS_4134 [Henneguya salminicola]|nr:hypothetical protein HZS_4134 [Henneguya salminicola]